MLFHDVKGGTLSHRKDTPFPEATCGDDSVDWRSFLGPPCVVWADDSRCTLGKEPSSQGHPGAESRISGKREQDMLAPQTP